MDRPLAKKKLPAEGCSRSNGKREESSRQKITDKTTCEMDCMKIRKGRLRRGYVENAEFPVKDLLLGKTLRLIEAYT